MACEDAKGATWWRNLVSGPNNTNVLALVSYGDLQMPAGRYQMTCMLDLHIVSHNLL